MSDEKLENEETTPVVEKEREVFLITKELLDAHEKAVSALRGKIFLEMDAEVRCLEGVEKYFAMTKWAEAIGVINNFATKQAIVCRETLYAKGVQIEASDEVKMDDLVKALHVPTRDNPNPPTGYSDYPSEEENSELDEEEDE